MSHMEASPAPDRYAAVRKIQTPLGQSLGSRVTSYAHIQPPTARVGVPMHTCRIGVPDPIHPAATDQAHCVPCGTIDGETVPAGAVGYCMCGHPTNLHQGDACWSGYAEQDVTAKCHCGGFIQRTEPMPDHDCGPSCPTPCPSDDDDPRGWQG